MKSGKEYRLLAKMNKLPKVHKEVKLIEKKVNDYILRHPDFSIEEFILVLRTCNFSDMGTIPDE